jgi:hypothetical protein
VSVTPQLAIEGGIVMVLLGHEYLVVQQLTKLLLLVQMEIRLREGC